MRLMKHSVVELTMGLSGSGPSLRLSPRLGGARGIHCVVGYRTVYTPSCRELKLQKGQMKTQKLNQIKPNQTPMNLRYAIPDLRIYEHARGTCVRVRAARAIRANEE